MVRNVSPILLALLDAFRQEIFDLAVDRAEIIFRPGGYGIV